MIQCVNDEEHSKSVSLRYIIFFYNFIDKNRLIKYGEALKHFKNDLLNRFNKKQIRSLL
jgi:hypothetical protein